MESETLETGDQTSLPTDLAKHIFKKMYCESRLLGAVILLGQQFKERNQKYTSAYKIYRIFGVIVQFIGATCLHAGAHLTLDNRNSHTFRTRHKLLTPYGRTLCMLCTSCTWSVQGSIKETIVMCPKQQQSSTFPKQWKDSSLSGKMAILEKMKLQTAGTSQGGLADCLIMTCRSPPYKTGFRDERWEEVKEEGKGEKSPKHLKTKKNPTGRLREDDPQNKYKRQTDGGIQDTIWNGHICIDSQRFQLPCVSHLVFDILVTWYT